MPLEGNIHLGRLRFSKNLRIRNSQILLIPCFLLLFFFLNLLCFLTPSLGFPKYHSELKTSCYFLKVTWRSLLEVGGHWCPSSPPPRPHPLFVLESWSPVSLWKGALFYFLNSKIEEWNGVGGGTEVQEGGNICIPMTDSCWCKAETNTILLSNYPSGKK